MNVTVNHNDGPLEKVWGVKPVLCLWKHSDFCFVGMQNINKVVIATIATIMQFKTTYAELTQKPLFLVKAKIQESSNGTYTRSE